MPYTGRGWNRRGKPERVKAPAPPHKPPNDEIAAYARDHITCRNCGAKPGFGCVEQADAWRTVCSARFADGAAVYVPLWKDANGRANITPSRSPEVDQQAAVQRQLDQLERERARQAASGDADYVVKSAGKRRVRPGGRSSA